MAEDNWSRQADEVEALGSIYGDDWNIEDPAERKYSVKVTGDSEKSVLLKFKFSEDYPSGDSPTYEICAPWMRREAKQKLERCLQMTCEQNRGECVVFQLIDNIQNFLLESLADIQNDLALKDCHIDDGTLHGDRNHAELQNAVDSCRKNSEGEDDDGSDSYTDEYGFDPSRHVYKPDPTADAVAAATDSNDGIPLPMIFDGEKLTDRKSVFQGHIAAITHKQQVKMVLDKLKENKKVAEATHNIYAYRVIGDRGVVISGCEDDGEFHAGPRMLHLLNIMDAQNVIVVVTRWYGGIHLGTDRFKHINNCTRDLLEAHGYIKDKSDKKGPKSAPSASSSQQKKKKR